MPCVPTWCGSGRRLGGGSPSIRFSFEGHPAPERRLLRHHAGTHARILDRQLSHTEEGEIEQLSDQHNSMLHQLASPKVGFSTSTAVNLSGADSATSGPVPTYEGLLSAQKPISITPNDVRSLPRLTGSADGE